MFSNLVRDPIDYCRERYEAEKCDGQLLVACSDAAVTFDVTEEVLGHMAVSIEPAAGVAIHPTGAERGMHNMAHGADQVHSEHQHVGFVERTCQKNLQAGRFSGHGEI